MTAPAGDGRANTGAGFVGSREKVLAALKVLGEQRCCYGVRDWPGRCDCKYGVTGPDNGMSSEQTGCPELASFYWLVDAMTDAEWSMLTKRAGGVPSGLFAASPDEIESRLHRADAAAHMAAENIKQVRALLTLEPV